MRRIPAIASFGVAFVATLGACSTGQAQETVPTAWQLLDDGDPTPWEHPMTYDTARGRAVLLTESGHFYYNPAAARPPATWELVGEDWVRRFVPEPTPWHSNGCMAYDSARQVTVLFGGMGNDETWEYDGAVWANRSFAVRPSQRHRCAMTYDSARGKIVLFGGEDVDFVQFGDTWEYDGTAWVQRTLSPSPPARSDAGITYDSDRSRVIVHAGQGPLPGPPHHDIWEYDGAAWVNKTPFGPNDSPSHRRGSRLAFDPVRKRTVMFGGLSQEMVGDTWEWNGTKWTQVLPAQSPDPRFRMPLVWDAQRGRIVGFGGQPAGEARNDTWAYDGTNWTRIAVSGLPGVRNRHGLAYDPRGDRLVLYGGRNHNIAQPNQRLTDTWTYELGSWQEELAAGHPDTHMTPLVYDPAVNLIVGFSGPSPATDDPTRDIHRYDPIAGSWSGGSDCCPEPDARNAHPIALAPGLGGLAVFGGSACCQFGAYYMANDLWTFDGNAWNRHSPATLPAARRDHGLAYDTARSRLVTYGGLTTTNDASRQSDTWIYDGTDWQLVSNDSPPGARRSLSLSYDASRDRVVLFGDGSALEGVTWEFDGASWIAMPTPLMPDETRCWTQAAYDSKREVTWLFGGQNCQGQGYFNDTWAYGADPDGDGKVGGLDNCRTTSNPGQENLDGDAAGDVCDCAASDPNAWASPLSVTGVTLSGPATTTLVWDDQTAEVGTGVVYDVATGSLDELRTGGWVGATCLASQTAAPSASDSRVPTDGTGFWYLVRARNACGAGSFGAPGLDLASPCP